MITVILIKKIATLFLIMLSGTLVVKTGLLKTEDSSVFSAALLYLMFPCMIIKSYQIEYSQIIKDGLILSIVAAIGIHCLLFIVISLISRPLHLSPVEKATAIYSNAGNFIIPIVVSILGSEWVIYCSGFIAIQMILLWSHCKILLENSRGIYWKKILTNVNLIAIIFGLGTFFCQFKLPSVILDACDSLGSMIAPCGMIITGMLIGEMSKEQLFGYKRTGLIVFIRLIFMPLICICALKLVPMDRISPIASKVLFISMLATASPQASAVVVMEQMYGNNPQYASTINVATTLCCIFTMPIMTMIWEI